MGASSPGEGPWVVGWSALPLIEVGGPIWGRVKWGRGAGGWLASPTPYWDGGAIRGVVARGRGYGFIVVGQADGGQGWLGGRERVLGWHPALDQGGRVPIRGRQFGGSGQEIGGLAPTPDLAGSLAHWASQRPINKVVMAIMVAGFLSIQIRDRNVTPAYSVHYTINYSL